MNLNTAINKFSAHHGANIITYGELAEVCRLIRCGQKGDAINALRDASLWENDDVHWNTATAPDPIDGINTFENFLADRDIKFTEHGKLGLKEARDVVTFIINNVHLEPL